MLVQIPLMRWNQQASHSRIQVLEDGFTASSTSPSYFSSAIGDYAMQPGHIYYFEVLLGTREQSTIEAKVGVSQSQFLDNDVGFSGTAMGWAFYASNGGQKRHNANSGTHQYGLELRESTEIGVLVDMVHGRLGFKVRGEWCGWAFTAPEFVCYEPLYAGFSLLNASTWCTFLKQHQVWDVQKGCVFAARYVPVFRRIPNHLMKEIAEYMIPKSAEFPKELLAALLESRQSDFNRSL